LAAVLLFNRARGIDRPFFVVSIAVLLALPLARFGPHNDLVMRASIPALSIMMFSLVDGWARSPARDHRWFVVLIAVLVGAVSPITEIARALTWARWPANPARTVVDVTQGNSPNYLLTFSPRARLAGLLRPPVIAPTCARAPSGPPPNGTVLTRRASGGRQIVVVNDLDEDAIVKLRDERRRIPLAVYVRGRSRAAVSGVPEGRYTVIYAPGSIYSEGCQTFLKNMDAFEVDQSVSHAKVATIVLDSRAPLGPRSHKIDFQEFIYE
jgi:hypothetical protein